MRRMADIVPFKQLASIDGGIGAPPQLWVVAERGAHFRADSCLAER